MPAFGASDSGSNPDRTTIRTEVTPMLQKYVIDNGAIVESTGDDCTWCRISEPQGKEIIAVAQRYGFEESKLIAALDADEPSQFDFEDGIAYLLVDVPYRTSDDGFNTTPMMIAISDTCVVTVCKNDEYVLNRLSSRRTTDKIPVNNHNFTMKILLAITREYQLNLKEIDSRRKKIEESIREEPQDKDILTLHELENSLVYFITSLKSLKLIIDQIHNADPHLRHEANEAIFKKIIIETQQAIEMGTIYREILDSTRDLASTMINNRLSNTMKWLTGATIVLTIPMIITGAYGMNVDLPIQVKSYAFAAIVAITGGTCLLISALLRKKKIF